MTTSLRFLLLSASALSALLAYAGRMATPAPPAAADLPVMRGHTTWELRGGGGDFVVELSGLCLSKDGDFLWGVGDNGDLYRIDFDGTYTNLWTCPGDMEGMTIDPATGDLYICVEPNMVCGLKPPYTEKTTLFVVDDAEKMGNSGIEGIAWHNGSLYLGSQTKAMLWECSVSGEKLREGRSLREIAPTMSEIADLCYDPVSDRLWAIDSNSNKDRPRYRPFTIYLFDGDATRLLATYQIGGFANRNPEAVCVDRARSCVWIAEDCGDGNPSLLHKVEFSGL